MTCEQLVELVTAYLEDQLPLEERTAFEEHLARCPGCETYVAQFRTTVGLLGELPPASISTEARRDLLAAFAEWRVPRQHT